MSPHAKRLLENALSLPDQERADLAAQLIDSLDHNVDADADHLWSAEIEQRVRDLDAGKAETISWPELRARLMGRLNDSSAA